MALTFYNGYGQMKTYEIPKTTIKRTPWTFICHRGWTISDAPLNTIPSIYAVRANGYDWTEIDVRTTADGVLVLSHDATITGTDADGTEQTLTIADSTLEALQAMTLATSETYGAVTIPTLETVLDMASFIGLGLVLDIKSADYEAVARAVLAHSLQGNVVYGTQDNTENAQAVLAVDVLARFNFGYPSSGDCTAIMDAVGGDTSKINLTISAADASLADKAEAAKAAGGNLYIWNITPNLYPSCADCTPAIMEFQSGREASADMNTAIAEYINAKTFW